MRRERPMEPNRWRRHKVRTLQRKWVINHQTAVEWRVMWRVSCFWHYSNTFNTETGNIHSNQQYVFWLSMFYQNILKKCFMLRQEDESNFIFNTVFQRITYLRSSCNISFLCFSKRETERKLLCWELLPKKTKPNDDVWTQNKTIC